MELLKRVDILMVNDSEARELSGDWNIHRAGRWILEHGPKRVVIKQGEYGALLIEPGRTFYVPAFPLEEVFDPDRRGRRLRRRLHGLPGAHRRGRQRRTSGAPWCTAPRWGRSRCRSSASRGSTT